MSEESFYIQHNAFVEQGAKKNYVVRQKIDWTSTRNVGHLAKIDVLIY